MLPTYTALSGKWKTLPSKSQTSCRIHPCDIDARLKLDPEVEVVVVVVVVTSTRIIKSVVNDVAANNNL